MAPDHMCYRNTLPCCGGADIFFGGRYTNLSHTQTSKYTTFCRPSRDLLSTVFAYWGPPPWSSISLLLVRESRLCCACLVGAILLCIYLVEHEGVEPSCQALPNAGFNTWSSPLCPKAPSGRPRCTAPACYLWLQGRGDKMRDITARLGCSGTSLRIVC